MAGIPTTLAIGIWTTGACRMVATVVRVLELETVFVAPLVVIGLASRMFQAVGICGGYTTFSTFSLDAWYLIERGLTAASLAYMLSSVVCSVVALVAALQLIRILP